jgi:hypothetical protein
MFGRYTYEILGGILIFASSLVGEQMSPGWKKRSYYIFGLLALGYMVVGIALDRDTSSQQGKLEQTITQLRSTITHSESARQSDRDAFLSQFNVLNKQISDIRTNVQTESLRKQLDETQRSVARTQEALEKREVRLDFLINGQANPTEITAHKQQLANSSNYEFVITYGLMNNSNEDVAAGVAELSLACSDCGNMRFVGVDGWPNWGNSRKSVGRDFVGIPKHSLGLMGRVGIISDTNSFAKQTQIGVRYRCLLCVPEDWHIVTVNLAE